MDHFLYRNGELHAEDVPLAEIARAVGTPFYVYSAATLTRHYRLFDEGLDGLQHLVCYAVKANSNQAVLKLLGDLGAGFDVVSGGEYARVRALGIPGARIVFSGVGKTRDEMRMALEGGVRQINLESEPEMRALSEVAVSMGTSVPVTVRVNPDVDARTHEKIATGRKENKFGIPIGRARAVYAEAARLPGLEVIGIDVHIGSQLTDLEPFRDAYLLVADLTRQLRADGHDIRRLDLGGGLGIPYERSNTAPPLPLEYCRVIHDTVGDLGVEVEIEPGRLIAGNAGLLVSELVTTHFAGMSVEESRPLLRFLFAHLQRPEFICRVRWEKGTVVVWDNRCTQHLAINDYPDHRRVMRRVLIGGWQPVPL